MRFFTKEWWGNDCKNAEHVFAKYDAHFLSIHPFLPAQLIDLKQSHTLHDSEVKRISSFYSEKKVVLELLGWDRELKHPVRYWLEFLGVEIFHQVLPQQSYVESELGDLGYWELDRCESLIQLSMLFVSGAEFTLTFSDFRFTYSNERA